LSLKIIGKNTRIKNHPTYQIASKIGTFSWLLTEFYQTEGAAELQIL